MNCYPTPDHDLESRPVDPARYARAIEAACGSALPPATSAASAGQPESEPERWSIEDAATYWLPARKLPKRGQARLSADAITGLVAMAFLRHYGDLPLLRKFFWTLRAKVHPRVDPGQPLTIVGELLTKVAIVGSGWGFYREGLLSFKAAAASVCAGLLLSFGRDQSLRNRGIVRLVPNFGYVWAACMILLLSTLWAVEVLVGTAIITSVRATAIASICAIAYSVYATTCEAAARQVFRWIFSCDDGELDRVTGRREDTASYDYSGHEYDDEYEDGDDDDGCDDCGYDVKTRSVVMKKVCKHCNAIIDWEATRCWGCGKRCKVTPPDRLNVIEVPRLTVDPDR